MDDVGFMFAKRHINACNPKELALDENLGEMDVEVTILSYPRDIAQVMSIWRWHLS